MATVVRIQETGGPDVLRVEEIEVGAPGPGQVRLRQTTCGVNYIDTYHRSGLYPLPSLPSGIGMEGTGVVEAVGDGVDSLKTGDRVVYGCGPIGGYASERLIPADKLVILPDGVADEAIAGTMLRGMTVQYLTRRLFRVEPGMTVLVHAAAGGVGLIACQWLKHLGATVIGTVGSDDKAKLAKAHGCDHPIVYTRDDFVSAVKDITGGKGVQVVYDGVGAAVFDKSLDCLARMGMMVQFGNSSGPAPKIDPLTLSQKGSLFLTRPTLMDYTATREDLMTTAGEYLDMVAAGTLDLGEGSRYALKDVRKAHEDMEGRRTTGSVALLP